MSDQTSSLTIRIGVAGVPAALSDIKKVASALTGAFGFVTAELDPSKAFEGIKSALEFGSTLEKLHNRTGASVSDLVAINSAFKRVGSSAEDAAGLIAKMQKAVALAASGQDAQAIKDFSILGLDPKQLAALNAEQKLLAIGKAMNAVANADQRAAISMDIFGKSGAQSLEVFQDGKAMDILAKGGGKFGEVMQRNAAAFHDAIFDLGQLSGIGKKFWVGFLDLIPVQEISDTISSAIKSVDFVGFGQNAGALVSVIINSWRDGKFPEMLGLLIEAGFELGVDAVKTIWNKTWEALTGATAGQIYLSLINAVMSFGVGAAKFLIRVFEEPIIYMAAGFDWLGSHLKEIFTDSINFFITQWDKFVSTISGKKGNIIPLIDKRGSDTFGESLADMRKFIEPLFSSSTDFLTQSLQQSRDALGFNQKLSGSDNTKANALARLNSLIQEQIALRKSATTEIQAQQGAIVEAFNVNTYISQQEIDLQGELLKIKRQIAGIDTDYTKTAAQKYSERKTLLQNEIADYQKAIDDNNAKIKSGALTPADTLELTKRNDLLIGKRDGAQAELDKMGADPNSFSQQFNQAIGDLKTKWGTLAQNMAQTFQDVFTSAVTSISSGITGLIMGTKTWGQALQQIGNTVLTTIIQQIVEMGVKFVMSHVIMRGAMAVTSAIGSALGWKQVGETNAQEASKAPALATNAATASVGSYGSAAIVGAIAAVAAIGLITAAALGAFYTGGYTGAGGKYDVAGTVHRGEFVMNADAVNRIGLPTLEALHSGGDVGNAIGSGTTLHVHTWADENAMLKFLRENDDAKHVIVDTVNKRVRLA